MYLALEKQKLIRNNRYYIHKYIVWNFIILTNYKISWLKYQYKIGNYYSQ